MQRTRSLGITGLLFASLIIHYPQHLSAQTHAWFSTSSGLFNTPTNWTPTGVPGPSSQIEFNVPANINVDLTTNQSVRSITKTGQRVTFVGGHALKTQDMSNVLSDRLSFQGTGTRFENTSIVNLGSDVSTLGELWIRENASAQTNTIVVAPVDAGTGRLVVVDPGSSLNNNGALTIGEEGDGILFLNEGGVLTTGSSLVADGATSNSLAIITNNSRWDTNGTLTFGNIGDANVDITAGGMVTGGDTIIGRRGASESTVTVTGDQSLLHVDSLLIGTADGTTDGGIGHLEILSGEASVHVGTHSGANFSGNHMVIADEESTSVVVRNSSTVSTGDLYLGSGDNAFGRLDIYGDTSDWYNLIESHVEVADTFVLGSHESEGDNGEGVVYIHDNGRLTAENGELINGSVSMRNGGRLEFKNLVLGNDSGSVFVDVSPLGSYALGPILSIGVSVPEYELSTPTVFVGSESEVAEMTIHAGSLLRTCNCYIGHNEGPFARVTVAGSNSVLDAYRLQIRSDSELFINGGGKAVSRDIATISGAALVSVQGSGATFEVANRLYVYSLGSDTGGTLTLADDAILDVGELTVDSISTVDISESEIRAEQIENEGLIAVSGPTTFVVSGFVFNKEGAMIDVQADTVFDGKVSNSGEISINSGTCTFANRLQGSGRITGNGTVLIHGTVVSFGEIEIDNDVVFDTKASTAIAQGKQDYRLIFNGDCQLDGTLRLLGFDYEIVSGDTITVIEFGGNVTGTFVDLPEGAIFARRNGNVLRISYVGGDGNDVVLTGEPGVATISPDSMAITRGRLARGNVSNLFSSDNSDLSIRRNTTDVQSVTEFEAETVSPSASPVSLTIKLEGSVFARSPVAQTISLFNYQTNSLEEIDSRDAQRFTDNTVEVIVTGDVSRFVEPDTNVMKARVRYQSAIARQQFTSNTDQLVWVVDQ